MLLNTHTEGFRELKFGECNVFHKEMEEMLKECLWLADEWYYRATGGPFYGDFETFVKCARYWFNEGYNSIKRRRY